MFDTSIIRSRAVAAPRRMTLGVSVLIHSIAVAGAIALTLTSTQLPSQPPRQLELYRSAEPPAAPPPPLGRPNAAHPRAAATPPPARPVALQPLTAPPVVPNQTPSVAPEASHAEGPPSTDTSVGDVPIGSWIGVDNSLGPTDVVSTGPSTSTAPYTPGIGVTSARVISRVEPRFPPNFVQGIRFAIVVVRCVIGKGGEIRDPEIVTSSFPPFNAAVLDALRQWKFAPGAMHGQPVDTWFELTVRFEVR